MSKDFETSSFKTWSSVECCFVIKAVLSETMPSSSLSSSWRQLANLAIVLRKSQCLPLFRITLTCEHFDILQPLLSCFNFIREGYHCFIRELLQQSFEAHHALVFFSILRVELVSWIRKRLNTSRSIFHHVYFLSTSTSLPYSLFFLAQKVPWIGW